MLKAKGVGDSNSYNVSVPSKSDNGIAGTKRAVTGARALKVDKRTSAESRSAQSETSTALVTNPARIMSQYPSPPMILPREGSS